MGQFISWIQENMPSSDNSGEAQESDENQPKSLSGMISTLVPILIISLVYIVIFLILRRSQRRFYAPRTYLGSLREFERTPDLPTGMFNWFGTFWKIPDTWALKHQSLDSYLFLRYLRVCTTICFVSLCVTWPILFPINITGGGGKKELEILSYANVDIEASPNRLYAHTFVAWIVYGFVIYMITRECIFYISLRQAFLLTPHYSKRISSRTVLFTSVPEDYLNEERLRTVFGPTVRHVWIAGQTKALDKLIEERDKTAFKLEKAEIKLLKKVNKARTKAQGASAKDGAEKNGHQNGENGVTHDMETGNVAARWITAKERPHHRTGPLGLIGKKVDTIEWCRSELKSLIPRADTAQIDWRAGKYDKNRAVFVEFQTQTDAQAAFQMVAHHQALHMAPRYIGVKPDEIVWKSLAIPWWQRIIRRYLVTAFIAILIIFWAVPVGIVGVIAQVNTLKSLPGLTWIGDIPSPILGLVSGLLPSVALAILMALVPVVMRLCAKLSGAVSLSEVELFTQNAYFCFQLIQVFLIRTITDSASTAIVQIAGDPSSVFTILSGAIPTSSNFYISYFIVQGLTIATSVMTQVIGCVIFNILYKFLAGTPRALYTKWTSLSAIMWGSVMPVYTTIVLISITYSVIAPLMLFWSTLGIFLFYLAYRYNVLFVSDSTIDTRGLIYPRALKQLFAGVYLAEICLVGMFAVSKAAGPAALTALFLIFTILYHITLNKALGPLLNTLPRTLQAEEDIFRENQLSGAGVVPGETGATNGQSKGVFGGEHTQVSKPGNFLMKWLKPWIYADYFTLRKLVPHEDNLNFPYERDHEIEAGAYLPPSVTSVIPTLWIPADAAGASRQEVAETSKVIPITDAGCTMNEKGSLVWDAEDSRPPIWEEKIYY